MKVVCAGDCGIDHYLPSNERLIGGITANVARHASVRFPHCDEIVVVSCLGDDDNADQVLHAFGQTGIECLWTQQRGRTPVQYIEVQPDGERKFVRYDAGVLANFQFMAEQKAAIGSSDLLIAPVYLQIVGLFSDLMAMQTKGRVAIDFADFLEHPDFSLLAEHIDNIDIGFFGLSADQSPAIERIASLAAIHDKLFIVTLGASGSVAFCGEQRFECAAVSVDEVVDTTGAGDAYAASFLGSYCHGASIEHAMQGAAETAASVVVQHGSFPAYDSAEEA